MYDKELRKANLEKDITEIDELLNATFFDRLKAENIIVKHNTTDEIIGAYNSPLNPNSFPLEMLNDEAIKKNLLAIRDYLKIKLAKEQSNG